MRISGELRGPAGAGGRGGQRDLHRLGPARVYPAEDDRR